MPVITKEGLDDVLEKIKALTWVRVSIFIFLPVFGILVGMMIPNRFNTVYATDIIHTNTHSTEIIKEFYVPSKDEVVEEIVRQAKSSGVSVYDAIRIANCESGFDPFIKNQQGSSARGTFQFIDKTWDNYCEGDRLNYKDNIACFMELYPEHPSWWACH